MQRLKTVVLSTMRHDDVYECIVKDDLIVYYGKTLLRKLGSRRKHIIYPNE